MLEGERNIVLAGFMATGKTAVGRRLAECLRYAFVDLDALIEAEAGMPIPRLFAEQGEATFRDLEARMVSRVVLRKCSVIATGGGAVVNPRNLEALKRCGVLITLTADPETILSRIGGGANRPMLAGGPPRERILELLAARAEAYARADMTIDTSRYTVDEVVDCILRTLSAQRTVGSL